MILLTGIPGRTRETRFLGSSATTRSDYADPQRIDFEPGELSGGVSGELGCGGSLSKRPRVCCTSDKDGLRVLEQAHGR